MTRFRVTCAMTIAVLTGLAVHTTAAEPQSRETVSEPRVRVGTFDSRALAMAYFGSEAFHRQLSDMRAEYETAKTAGDEERVRELDAEGSALQELMHKQGFSTWPVDDILETIKERIPAIAAEADVEVIVSKWDMVYQRSGVALVDVTDLMVRPFEPDPETRKAIQDIQKQDPVPLDIVWCKVPLPSFMRSDPHLRGYLGHGHLLICAPTPDERLQLGWVIRKGKFGELRSRGLPEWMDELAGHVSPDLGDHLRRHREETSRPFLLDVVSDRVEPWSTPGMLLIGDAAHTMSPVFAQGLNIAIRDAVVAANELVPVLTSGAGPDALDAAARRIEEERVPEVVEIKRLQALPPRFVLSNSWWSAIALRVFPAFLFRRGPPGRIVRSVTTGVTDVKLRV